MALGDSFIEPAERTTADPNAAADMNAAWGNTKWLKDNFSLPSGAVIMAAIASAPSGWLLCNGDTIGDGSSGADHTGDDYEDLFEAIKGSGYGNSGSEVWGDHDTVKLPDLAGVFPRGAGTHDTLQDATGSAFTATLGQYENDKFQRHYHNVSLGNTAGGSVSVALGGYTLPTDNWGIAGNVQAQSPSTDGSNGNPRTGAYTQPATAVVNFIIKL